MSQFFRHSLAQGIYGPRSNIVEFASHVMQTLGQNPALCGVGLVELGK
jgi:hypothetical protein